MKLFHLAAMTGLVLVAASCSRTFSTDSCEGSSLTAFGQGTPDSLSISVSIEYPVKGASKDAIAKLTQEIFTRTLGEDFAQMKPQEAVDSFIVVTDAAVKDANSDIWNEEGEENNADRDGCTWEEHLNGWFASNYKNIYSYTIAKSSFEGGAHGYDEQTSFTMNLKTGEIIDEEHFFVEGYNDFLADILRGHLVDAIDDEAYEALFVKDIEPNGNFTVNEEGVVYHYNAYEIGPYYLGAIDVSVPWSDLTSLVRREIGLGLE